MNGNMDKTTKENKDYSQFLVEIKARINKSRYEAARAVNQEIIQLYWDIGRSITEKQQSLGWGKSIVETLSEDLQKEFPRMSGFGKSNLWSMAQFYAEYHDSIIIQPLVGEISWSKHLVIMSKCKDMQERQFYILTTKKFGRTKPQKNIPEYKGKMEFYLNLLNDRVKLPHENEAIGIIVCKSQNRTIVEYALKDSKKPTGIATYNLSATLPEAYKTLLPTPDEIAKKLDVSLSS